MTPVATFAAVTVDCADPAALASFYARVTGWEVAYSDDDYAYLGDGGAVALGFQRVAGHRPAPWPDESAQLHLDFRVPDLAEAADRVVGFGARRPDFQPGGDKWIVLIDPAGHPFCLSRQG